MELTQTLNWRPGTLSRFAQTDFLTPWERSRPEVVREGRSFDQRLGRVMPAEPEEHISSRAEDVIESIDAGKHNNTV